MTFKEMAKDTIESLYRKIILMEGEEIRDRGDRKIFDAYMSLRTLTDQNYIHKYPGSVEFQNLT